MNASPNFITIRTAAVWFSLIAILFLACGKSPIAADEPTLSQAKQEYAASLKRAAAAVNASFKAAIEIAKEQGVAGTVARLEEEQKQFTAKGKLPESPEMKVALAGYRELRTQAALEMQRGYNLEIGRLGPGEESKVIEFEAIRFAKREIEEIDGPKSKPAATTAEIKPPAATEHQNGRDLLEKLATQTNAQFQTLSKDGTSAQIELAKTELKKTYSDGIDGKPAYFEFQLTDAKKDGEVTIKIAPNYKPALETGVSCFFISSLKPEYTGVTPKSALELTPGDVIKVTGIVRTKLHWESKQPAKLGLASIQYFTKKTPVVEVYIENHKITIRKP